MFNGLMVHPRSLGEDSTVFVSGNDAGAKATVVSILKEFWLERYRNLRFGRYHYCSWHRRYFADLVTYFWSNK
jgi:hypothetical protein